MVIRVLFAPYGAPTETNLVASPLVGDGCLTPDDAEILHRNSDRTLTSFCLRLKVLLPKRIW